MVAERYFEKPCFSLVMQLINSHRAVRWARTAALEMPSISAGNSGAVLSDAGARVFLFSYDVERRPIGTRNARMTTQFYLKHKNLESGYADKGVGYSGHFCDHNEGRTCCNWCCSIIPSSSGKPDCMRERVRLAEHCDEMD